MFFLLGIMLCWHLTLYLKVEPLALSNLHHYISTIRLIGLSGTISMDYELIAKALFENYETIYDINLDTNEYKSFHESDAYKKLQLDKCGEDFFEGLSGKIAEIIAPEDQAYVLRMLSKDNLIKGLEKEKYYTFFYRIRQDGKEIYHQIRAAFQPVNDSMHVFMGVKNIDFAMKQEEMHREELRAMQQKEVNHMKAVLASAAAYMEANLSRNIMLEKSDDHLDIDKRFIKKLPSLEEIPEYDKMHSRICENLIVENKKKYQEMGSRKYLLNCFEKGELRSSVSCSVYTNEGGIRPCKEVFFLYQEESTKDIHVFCVIYDLTQQQKAEREREMLEQELKMSRIRNFTSQIQPHFLYNALGSIQEVMLMNPEYASDLLGDFTVHLRSCIRAMTKDEPLSFSQELENVKAYINIEKMRFGNKLKAHYELGNTRFSILPLTVQPLVENAIRHGIYGRGIKGGDVYIRTKETTDFWIVEVEDNGVGFDVDDFERKQRTGQGESTGIKNIKFRLEKVMGADLKVKSVPGEGSCITIYVPRR